MENLLCSMCSLVYLISKLLSIMVGKDLPIEIPSIVAEIHIRSIFFVISSMIFVFDHSVL